MFVLVYINGTKVHRQRHKVELAPHITVFSSHVLPEVFNENILSHGLFPSNSYISLYFGAGHSYVRVKLYQTI